MRAVDLLRSIRDQQPVSPDDLRAFILGIGRGEIPDYQATAFTMAVYLQGLAPELTVALTLAMRDSGRVIDLSDIDGPKVDKHSTGGVGDKISIPLAPMVAACGLRVPMISGRGLGHTGGTLDKLESIPGFRVNLSIERLHELVDQLGVCLIGQTDDLAPADRKLYALRDVTATVESIPLITASILSKKLAEGLDALVLDVKVGRGAFMKTEAAARELARSLVDVGKGAGVRVRAVLTHMDEPLGRTIGNALEIRESIAILRGEGPADTTELTYTLGSDMLVLGGIAPDLGAARRALEEAVKSGAALDKLRQLIAAQHGDASVVDHPERLPQAEAASEVEAAESGTVAAVDSYALGMAAMRLGAGRATAEDRIDPAVGLEVLAKVGDSIQRGQPLVRVHHRRDSNVESDVIRAAFAVQPGAVHAPALVIDRVE